MEREDLFTALEDAPEVEETPNLPVPRRTIEDLVAARDRALGLYGEAYKAIGLASAAVSAARNAAEECSPGINNYNHEQAREIAAFYNAVALPDRDQYLRTAKRLLDLNAWAWIVQKTDLERLMDHESKEQLRRQMRYIPERVNHETGALINEEELCKGMPPLTVENIMATLEAFRADSADIMARGVAVAFSKLDRRFKSHDGFRVGARVVLTNVFNSWGSLQYGGVRDTLIDIERVFAVLDGVRQSDFRSGIEALQASRSLGCDPHQSECETAYFRIKGYKNGNAHLWFKRDDLLRKVNQVLAKYYGEVIGDGHVAKPDPLRSPKTEVARYFGFYPSPEGVVVEVLDRALLHGERPLRVLEPSAGTGNISRSAASLYGVGHRVDCVEIQSSLAQALEASKLYGRVVCKDFLDVRPEDMGGLYDRVLMNPPFDRERDIDHVMHAWDFLKADGRLVSVMSAGTEWRETSKSKAFCAFVAKNGGRFWELPERSFASVGTNVNTTLLVLNKDRRSAW